MTNRYCYCYICGSILDLSGTYRLISDEKEDPFSWDEYEFCKSCYDDLVDYIKYGKKTHYKSNKKGCDSDDEM